MTPFSLFSLASSLTNPRVCLQSDRLHLLLFWTHFLQCHRFQRALQLLLGLRMLTVKSDDLHCKNIKQVVKTHNFPWTHILFYLQTLFSLLNM